MKKRLVFTGLVLAALILTSGSFMFSFTSASTTLRPVMADANFAAYQTAARPPDWNSILPSQTSYSETLLPAADTGDISFPAQYPSSGGHYDKVADISSPDMNAYISTMGACFASRDIYSLSPFAGRGGLEKITGVTLLFRITAGGNYSVCAKGELKINGQLYDGPAVAATGPSFITKSWTSDVNPGTRQPWTYNDIDSLEAGLTGYGYSACQPLLCTQVYIQVNYTYTQLQGAVPAGDLYVVTPHPQYTGDMCVKIYITNTAALLKAYNYLNIKLFVPYSLEAARPPAYQVLSLENGLASFNIEGGSAASYTVSVIGGGYRLISEDPADWGAGWAIAPEFFCEVSQR